MGRIGYMLWSTTMATNFGQNDTQSGLLAILNANFLTTARECMHRHQKARGIVLSRR